MDQQDFLTETTLESVIFSDIINNFSDNSFTKNVKEYDATLEKYGFTYNNLSYVVTLLLTDWYQLTMSYAYYMCQDKETGMRRAEMPAVFEMFFRTCPFGGQYTIFAGLDKVVDVFKHIRFTHSDVDIIKNIFHSKGCDIDEGFGEYLLNLDFTKVTVSSVRHGEVIFPTTPVMIIEGPLILGQLLETLLLVLVSYPTLVATCARRLVNAAQGKKVYEFGLRRAQGPGGADDATKYSQVGGCSGTSHVKCGYVNNINIIGTIAHSFVSGFKRLSDVKDQAITNKITNQHTDSFLTSVLVVRQKLGKQFPEYLETKEGELAAFIQYAITFPRGFAALLDTYNTISSGIKNYIIVAIALHELGFIAIGVRLDSGDLSYLSIECRNELIRIDQFLGTDFLKSTVIFVSNELSEEVILSLQSQGHSIDVFAVGTHLVTCKQTPALGMVYKLCELNGEPVMKFSEDEGKSTLPYRKNVYRLYDSLGIIVLDLMLYKDDGNIDDLIKNGKIYCRHPVISQKKSYHQVISYKKLHHYIWKDGIATSEDTSVYTAKIYCEQAILTVRPDILRFVNPTPAKISVTRKFHAIIEELTDQNKDHEFYDKQM